MEVAQRDTLLTLLTLFKLLTLFLLLTKFTLFMLIKLLYTVTSMPICTYIVREG